MRQAMPKQFVVDAPCCHSICRDLFDRHPSSSLGHFGRHKVKSMFAQLEDMVPFDFCVIAGGCNFNPLSSTGASPWFPSIHESEIAHSQLDERFLEGRRRRILAEHLHLRQLDMQKASVLIVGAGYTSVEWACELCHFFPHLQITVCDFLPRCLGPLPEAAAQYCENYMARMGIRTIMWNTSVEYRLPFRHPIGASSSSPVVVVLGLSTICLRRSIGSSPPEMDPRGSVGS